MSAPARYDATTQTLHWLTAILVVVAFFYGPTGSEAVVFAPGRNFDRDLHETLGLWIFALTVVRLLWGIGESRPRSSIAGSISHWVLYGLLIALPLTAVLGSWLSGHAITLFAGQIPSPLPVAHRTGMAILEVHAWLGDAILWLAGLHAAAAIYHHWVLKDGVLSSMLPALRRSGSPPRAS